MKTKKAWLQKNLIVEKRKSECFANIPNRRETHNCKRWTLEMDKYWLCIRLSLKDWWEPFLRYRIPLSVKSSKLAFYFSSGSLSKQLCGLTVAFVKILGLKTHWIWFLDTQNTFYLMVKGLKNAYLMHFPSLHSWFRCSVCFYLKCSSSHNQRVIQRVKKHFVCQNLFQIMYNQKQKSNVHLRNKHKTALRNFCPDLFLTICGESQARPRTIKWAMFWHELIFNFQCSG